MNIIPKIFKIDKAHRLLKGITDTENLIKKIIKTSYGKLGWNLRETELEFAKFTKEGYTYFLYLYSVADKQSKWAAFLPAELKENPDIFNQTKLTLVLFVETEHNLYAAIGGNAYPIVVNFVDHSFGLDIYDRIIDIDKDEAFSTKSRRIIGQQVGLSEQFRDNYKMINYLQFGKIPKELHIKLDTGTSNEHFSFLLKKANERLKISAGKALSIHREVDFNTLHKIINELCTINELAPQELLSSYTEVKDDEIIKELQIELNNRIFNYIPILQRTATSSAQHFEFDFCSPNNIEAFYTAETYQLKEKGEEKHETFATLFDKDGIFKTVVLRAYEVCGNNENAILFYLRGVRILCYRGTKIVTSSSFLFHLNAEFHYNGTPIFLIDTKWYRLKDAFVKSLEYQTATIFKTTKLASGILEYPWKLKPQSTHLIDEGDYNMQYDGKPGYFVLDTITPDGVELCDIVYFTDNELYLIHVKHSFTARVRELTNQILISARRLSEAVASKNQAFFDKVYASVCNKGRATNNLSSIEFANLFYNKTLVYVFATASQFTDDPLISDEIEKYTSNIARFSLTTCSSEIRTRYGDFKTCQIRRNEDLIILNILEDMHTESISLS
jgi:uncharacterized protein (TIGR04141 family)